MYMYYIDITALNPLTLVYALAITDDLARLVEIWVVVIVKGFT